MYVVTENVRPVWIPLTPRSVAAFAHLGIGRLLLIQLIVALLCGGFVAWFLYNECLPTIDAAIEKLPSKGEIRSSQLDWQGDSPQMLAEGNFLALTVDLNHSGGLRSPADIQVEFAKDDYRMRSLLGIMDLKYPSGWVIAFNQTELKPRWGAWRPMLLAGAVVGTALGLMCIWWWLSAVYCLPVWLAGTYANRDLTISSSWRLSGAALMPGAIIMMSAIVFFGLGLADLVGLMFLFAAHFVVGWIYLFLSLLFVPKTAEMASLRKNPFAARTD